MATATPGETRHFCLYNARSAEGDVLDAAHLATVTIGLYETDLTTVIVAPVTTTLSGAADYCTDTALTMPTTTGDYTLAALIDYDGLAVYDYAPLTVARASTIGITRRGMRRRLMQRLGDGLTLTATTATTGQTFTDANMLFLGNNKYNGRMAYACDGANAGMQRVISASSFETGTLTFRPEFPAGFLVGDELDIANERGMGWRFDEYHGAINQAIEEARAMGGTPYSALLDDPFAYGSTMTIPDEFETIDAVEYMDAQGFWVPSSPAPDAYSSGWSVAVDSGTIAIKSSSGYLANGRTVRLVGTATPRYLEDEDDRTLVNVEWMEARCLEMLLSSGLRMDPERGGLLNVAMQKAKILKRQAVPPETG